MPLAPVVIRRAALRATAHATLLGAAALLAACGGGRDAGGGRTDSTAAGAPAMQKPTTDTSMAGMQGMQGMEGMEMEVPTAPVAGTTGPAIFATCAACHGQVGQGIQGDGPPFSGSEWVTGNPGIPIRIILKGLTGPITVKGAEYNGSMPPLGGVLTDAQVAAVLSYERSSWGNSASPVTAEQVAAVRAAIASRTTQWTAAELAPMQTK